MSRYIGGNWLDPQPTFEKDWEELYFTPKMLLEHRIQQYLECEEIEQENIKNTYEEVNLYENEENTSKTGKTER